MTPEEIEDATLKKVEKMIEGTIRLPDYTEYYIIPRKEWDGRKMNKVVLSRKDKHKIRKLMKE